MADEDICGSTETADGEPCKNPPSRDDGRCHLHTVIDDERVEVGRDTDLTKQRQENIASMLEQGQSIRAACRCNDIAVWTFYRWLDRGDDQDEGIYCEFSERVARARGAGEAGLVDELLGMVRETGDTRTLLSIIKARYPDSWGDADTGEEGSTVNIHLSPTDDE